MTTIEEAKYIVGMNKDLKKIFEDTIEYLSQEREFVDKQEQEEIREIIQKFKPVKDKIEKDISKCSKALIKLSNCKLNSENINIGDITMGDNSKIVIAGKDVE